MSPFRTAFILGLLVTALVISAGCTQPAPAGTPASVPGSPAPVVTTAATPAPVTAALPPARALTGKKVVLETTMGNITIALDPGMPITAGNFETLVKKGYYDGVIFHRVISGFMIQGGDPTGTGRGGPGYTIPDEFTVHNMNSRGAVAMANTGQPDSGGSQFFINLVNNNFLDSKHPVFGEVVEGMDIVEKIGKTKTGRNDKPVETIKIVKATVL